MRISEIMTRNPSCVTPESTVREAAQLMKSENVGVLPVVDGNSSKRLVGIVTDRDIAIRVVADGAQADARVADVMTRDRLTTCSEGDSVEDVMKAMGDEQLRRIPIVNERGEVVGIVAQADVVRKSGNDKRAEATVEQISEPSQKHAQ
ncbi:MAG: domain containing protein [Gemmatimonadetes bacterium]|nr:domain containing protein [Gemmatimonadota bacterium]